MANAEPMRRVVRPVALGLALWCGLSAGCVELNTFVAPDGKTPPAGVPHQIQATWESRVLWTPDSVNNGKQVPVLAGQLFLFGPEIGYPMAGDGSVEIFLYDDTPVALGGQPVCIEGWNIDDRTLPRLIKKTGMLKPSYQLVVPWFTLPEHPEIKLVHLTVKFTPKGRPPLFHQSPPMPIGIGEVPPGFAFKAPAKQAPQYAAAPPQQPAAPAVQQTAYQQQLVPPQTAYQQQPMPPQSVPAPVQQAVYSPPAPAPVVPAVTPPGPTAVPAPVQQVAPPPPPPLPPPVTAAAVNAVPVTPPMPRYERIRIGTPRGEGD